MAIQIQLRQGTTTEHNTFTGAVGEVTVDTTNKTLRVHDGSTVGGTILSTLTGGLVPASQLPDATTGVKGAVILNNTLASTSTTQALTAAQGKALSDTMFGVGQTRNILTSRRVGGTTYTNTTARPIYVNITVSVASYQTSTLTINGVSSPSVFADVGSGGSIKANISEIILPSETYKLGGGTIMYWEEIA